MYVTRKKNMINKQDAANLCGHHELYTTTVPPNEFVFWRPIRSKQAADGDVTYTHVFWMPFLLICILKLLLS